LNQLESKSRFDPLASSPAKQKITITSSYLKKLQRRLAWANVLIPTVGSAIAVGSLWVWGISTATAILSVSLYALTMVGVEVGFHRYFSHGAFKANLPTRVLLAVLGSMAAQGPLIYWVSHHRRHHQYSDRPGDPHSPNLDAGKDFGWLRGLWHAHIGWLFDSEMSNPALYAKDLLRDPTIAKLDRFYPVWVLLGLAIPTGVGGLATQAWIGAVQGFLWGGLVRVMLVHHVVWGINSMAHVYGKRPLESGDRSTNNVWLALPSIGGAWHNNHHAFPFAASNCFEWWQIDLGGWFVRFLERCGWVWNVRMPTPETIAAKQQQQQQQDYNILEISTSDCDRP